ncbi:hypothetical protein [Bradyrhizobium sp. DOA9]|uniref:hypothetical protein n=1 Tax=Bradyrhizobium sp. DOA9 TaxID=1126627 RepID=UPI000A411098
MNGAAPNVGSPHAAAMKASRAHAAAVKSSPAAKAATSTAACKCIIRNKAGSDEDRGRKADQTVSDHSILPGVMCRRLLSSELNACASGTGRNQFSSFTLRA